MTYKYITKEQFKEYAKNKDNLTKEEWVKMINYTFLFRQGNIHGGKEKVYFGGSGK